MPPLTKVECVGEGVLLDYTSRSPTTPIHRPVSNPGQFEDPSP